MKTETREVYWCGYCKKMYLRKHACIKHEERCGNNPENYYACGSCDHLIKKDAKSYESGCDHEEISNVSVFFCEKKEHYVYLPKNKHKGNFFTDLDAENKPMPKECEDFKSEFDSINIDLFGFKID